MAKKVIKTVTTTTTEEVVNPKIMETHYLLILDRSGSMSSVRDVTISGFNEQIQKIRKLEEKYPDQKYYISLITFADNHDIIEVITDKPVAECKELTKEDYAPNGSTALLDAMGLGITKMEERLTAKMKDSDNYISTIVVIMTDGEENDSKNWKEEGKMKKLIERLNKDNRWTISYIGANQNAILKSAEYGIYRGNTANYSSTLGGTSNVAAGITATLSARAMYMSSNVDSVTTNGMSNVAFMSSNSNITEDALNTVDTSIFDLKNSTITTSNPIAAPDKDSPVEDENKK